MPIWCTYRDAARAEHLAAEASALDLPSQAAEFQTAPPKAYRRLPEVLAQHAGTIRVLHTLRPFAVAMAGKGEFDPFKD
jgi:hypothetical protein